MGILFPVVQKMDSYPYKLDIGDDQDRQIEFLDISHYDIGRYDMMADIGGCRTGYIFYGRMDYEEIGEQY